MLILAYYYLGKIEDPQGEVRRHKEFFQALNFRGRIYISEQGINGQASASKEHAEAYMAWMRADPRFCKMAFKIASAKEHAFPKMSVKVRRQLVAIDCEIDFSKRGTYLSPREWKNGLERRDENTLLLDVRNDYEWKIGHFEGAELPKLETFRQFPLYAEALKKERDPKKTAVMMYCTGGIRCEFFSAVLRKEGFEKVSQLEGGVLAYGLKEGSSHWKGKLFVFDDRLVVPISEIAKEPIAQCEHCKASCDVYYNCANVDCNALFVCCLACLREKKGCCSSRCLEGARVRPYQESAKPFRRLVFKLNRFSSACQGREPPSQMCEE